MFCMLLLVLLLLIDNRQKIKWVPVFLLENPLLHSVTVRNVSSIKSHLIKVILPWKRSVRNNYISNIAYTHHCWTQKNITPLNASNDPENLLQVHALPKKEKEKKKESKQGGEKKKWRLPNESLELELCVCVPRTAVVAWEAGVFVAHGKASSDPYFHCDRGEGVGQRRRDGGASAWSYWTSNLHYKWIYKKNV